MFIDQRLGDDPELSGYTAVGLFCGPGLSRSEHVRALLERGTMREREVVPAREILHMM